MNIGQAAVMKKKEQWLQGLRVDVLEDDIHHETEDGLNWSIAASWRTVWLMGVFDYAQNPPHWSLLSTLELRSQRIQGFLRERFAFDGDHAAPDNLNKSLRLLQRLRPVLVKIFQQGNPCVLNQLLRAMGYHIMDVKQGWWVNDERLHDTFVHKYPVLQLVVTTIAQELIHRLCLSYQQTLKQVDGI